MTAGNTNCLAGLACPKCGGLGPFKIRGFAEFTVHDDGTDEYQGVEWGEDSTCRCTACGHSASVRDFSSAQDGAGEDGTSEAPPATGYFAVVGRIHGDDEDCCYLFEAKDEDAAVEMFRVAITGTHDRTDAEALAERENVYVNHILRSDARIEDVYSYYGANTWSGAKASAPAPEEGYHAP